MEREQLDRLLAEYATGGLSEEDRKKLFAAALEDQALFEQLMEEDALREVIELPGARDRLIDALQVDEARLSMPASVAEPARRTPVWFAWAAGVGVVFVSGALSYILLDPGTSVRMAQATKSKDVKPFVAPPERPALRVATKVVVDAPPLVAEARRAEPLPALNIPLPAAPPPRAEQPMKDTAMLAKKIAVGNVEIAKPRADSVMVTSEAAEVKPAGSAFTATNAAAPLRQASVKAPPGAPARAELAGDAAREKTVAAAGGRAGEKAAADAARVAVASAGSAVPQAPVSAWRRSGEGVWVRLAPADSVGREDTIAIRYTPLRDGAVTLADAAGRTLVRRDGRGGEELDLLVPRAVLAGAQSGDVALTVTGGAATSTIVLRIR